MQPTDDDSIKRIEMVRDGLPVQTLAQVADFFCVSDTRLTELLGINRKKYFLRKRDQLPLGPLESDLLAGVLMLITLARDVFGDDTGAARSWFFTGQESFNGRQPIELVDTLMGRSVVANALRARILEKSVRSQVDRYVEQGSSETLRPLRIFLCHGSEDKPAVRDIYRRLRQDGMSPWLDEEDLLPGQEWESTIQAAVRGSDVVLVCLSKTSTTKVGFVQKELRLALDAADERPANAIFIVPARLEGCALPERLKRWHAVDLYEAIGYTKLLNSLRLRAEDLSAAAGAANSAIRVGSN